MKHRLYKVLLMVTSATAGLAGTPCEQLNLLSLPNTTITAAELVPAGPFQDPRTPPPPPVMLPAHCRVAMLLRPTSDSNIKVEVWLPANWNGKFQAVGNGAWAGSLNYPALATAVAAGYAAASTDTGHEGNNADFIPGHPEKLADFIYRSVHEMTVAAKVVINGFYGDAPKHSYWNGCSTGGRQAFTEAQRYAGDYDGIIAGAPAAYVTRLQGTQVWVSQQVHRSPDAFIPADKFSLLHDAVLAACDAQDGVKDGVLENPVKCQFDPAILACKETDGANCLNAAQVETARMMYSGPSLKGKNIFPGVEPGSENGWNMLAGPKVMSLAAEMYKFAAFNGSWDMKDFTLADIERFEKDKGPVVDSVDPNLKPFFAAKGKMLIYHGWADPGVAPMGSVNYFNNVIETVGSAAAHDSMRLFMVPGMGHCGGGDGTSTFNMIAALEQWVEKGKAPERIEASRVRNGKVDRTRPLCAYPSVAVYAGTGNTDDASSFSCK